MSISEVTDRVHALGNAWEQFKSVNDRRLAEIEKKGAADPLTVEQVNRINNVMDNYKSRLSQVETALSRPAAAMEYGVKFDSPFKAEHKDAFCAYLRKGLDSQLAGLESKALSVSSDPDGGYLVTSNVSDRIVRTVTESSPMRAVASIETISSDSLDIIEDTDAAAAGWTSEGASVSDTDTPQIGKKNIPVHELYAQPKATQKLIDDSSIDIEAWLAEKVADIFSTKESTAFVSGDGVGKPRGILSYADGTSWGQIERIASGDAATITADGIINLYYALKEEYAGKGTFLMNRSVVQTVRLLKEATTNQYLWQPGLAAGAPDTLLGAPVMQAADMESISAGNKVIAFADFKAAYQIVDRTGIRVLRDPFTDKPFVKFYTTKRVGGDVVNFEAIKLMDIAAS